MARNLRIARPDATGDELWEALESVGLAEVVAGIPGGLSTQIGWDGAALSGGQARRLALARSLLCGAEMLVLDEPTAHLDPETEANMIEVIAGLAPERTIVVASHSRALLGRCSQVLCLDPAPVARMAHAH